MAVAVAPLIALGLAGVLVLGAGARPEAALGACVPMPVEDGVVLGEVVFVGTVVRLENGDRWATVRVEERWRGARDLATDVQVRGGPEPGFATADDRVFARQRYLFVARNGPGYLEDDGCSATTPWTPELARFRPPDVSPAPDVVAEVRVTVFDLDTAIPLVALLGALVVAVLAYILILRARRRPPDWIR